jgi:WD40 repeat protein
VAVSPSGETVFVLTSGDTQATWAYDYATVAYNAATGAQEWVARYHGPGNGYYAASSVAVSPAGRTVFVTGKSTGATSGADYATVAYNATTGAQEWAARYHGPGNGDSSASSVAVSPSGRTVFVTGGSAQSISDNDYATVAYNAATGAQEWAARYHGPVTHYNQGSRDQGPAYNAGNSVAVSPSGRTVFVTGQDAGTTPVFNYATVAYDATTGAQEWAARYTAPTGGGAEALAVSPDGRTVFVFGGTYVTVAYHG